MAARVGTVTVPVRVELEGQAVKVLALRSATEWARSFVNAAPSPEKVVEAAKKFEQYLKGDNK
jgi:hypothetical protein